MYGDRCSSLVGQVRNLNLAVRHEEREREAGTEMPSELFVSIIKKSREA